MAPVSSGVPPVTLEPFDPKHAGLCPLAAVDLTVRVTGLVVEYELAQRFINTSGETLSALLRLPLPDDAAVRSVELTQGGRTLRAAVRDVDDARRAFDEARDEGRQAALAEEVRPNLLLLRVSALAPSVPIEVRTRIASPLAFEAGEGTVVVPVTMTPRYCPPGTDPEDARRVSPPFAKGERLYGLSFTLDLEAGGPIASVRSPSHALRVERRGEDRARVTLAEGEVLPDRDIVVASRVETSLDRLMIASARAGHGAPAVVLFALPPPRAASEEAILPRHVDFLLDRSGSMSGEPIVASKRALRGLLRTLGPRDRFTVIAFDDQIETTTSLRASDASWRVADAFIEGIDARGGTEILPALDCALANELPDDVMRAVVLITDGSVANEAEVVDRVAQGARTKGLRAHAVGIGPSVNRDFLRRFARAGHGVAEFVPATSDIEPVLLRFQSRSSAPLATEVSLTIEGLTATDLTPDVAGDVDLGQPLLVFARVGAAGRGTAVLRARTGDGPIERRWDFEVPAGSHGNPAIEALWARARVDDLLLLGDRDDEVRAIGLAYGIVTPRTALVAVERGEATADGPRREVEIPLHMPAGLTMGEIFAAGAAGAPACSEPADHDYDVVLDAAGASRLQALRALRELTGLALHEVKALLDGAPSRLRECLPWHVAEQVLAMLTARGVMAHIIRAGEPLGSPPVTRQQWSPPAVYAPYRRPPPPPFLTRAERLAAALGFLARAQSADGGFVDGPTTRLVLDAFAAAGATTERGPWRRQLARAEVWWASEGAPVAEASPPALDAMFAAQARGGAAEGGVAIDEPVRSTALLVLALARADGVPAAE